MLYLRQHPRAGADGGRGEQSAGGALEEFEDSQLRQHRHRPARGALLPLRRVVADGPGAGANGERALRGRLRGHHPGDALGAGHLLRAHPALVPGQPLEVYDDPRGDGCLRVLHLAGRRAGVHAEPERRLFPADAYQHAACGHRAEPGLCGETRQAPGRHPGGGDGHRQVGAGELCPRPGAGADVREYDQLPSRIYPRRGRAAGTFPGGRGRGVRAEGRGHV